MKSSSGNPTSFYSDNFFFSFVSLGPHPQHMEVPRLVVKMELQLLAYTTDTAMWDPSRICDLPDSSGQCWILNPLSKDRDRTCILMDTSSVCYHWATTGNGYILITRAVLLYTIWLKVFFHIDNYDGLQRHSVLNLPNTKTMRNKFLLFINQPVYMVPRLKQYHYNVDEPYTITYCWVLFPIFYYK